MAKLLAQPYNSNSLSLVFAISLSLSLSLFISSYHIVRCLYTQHFICVSHLSIYPISLSMHILQRILYIIICAYPFMSLNQHRAFSIYWIAQHLQPAIAIAISTSSSSSSSSLLTSFIFDKLCTCSRLSTHQITCL